LSKNAHHKALLKWSDSSIIPTQRDFNKYLLDMYDLDTQAFPNDAKTWYNKGIALGKLGRYEEAKQCYDKAKQLGYKL
jgi:pentatricopeptide repeat protein